MRPRRHDLTHALGSRRPRRIAAAALLSLLLAACAGGEDEEAAGDDPSSASTGESSSPAGESSSPTGEPRAAASASPSLDPSTIDRDALVSPEPSAPSSPSLRPSPPPASAGEVESLPEPVVQAVLAAASAHSGASPGDIEVVTARAVRFTDGSLGCPEPGRSYTQALVDGYRVVVEAAGEQLDYRLADRGEPRLCDGAGQVPSPRDDR